LLYLSRRDMMDAHDARLFHPVGKCMC
jgi:hypothetical protein